MAKRCILNVLGQDAMRRLSLAMDSAGLAFAPKCVLDYQQPKVILPAMVNLSTWLIPFYLTTDSI